MLEARVITQKVQANIVPWILSKYGVAYKRDGGPKVVKDMIIALVKRDNLAGLADQIDLLKDRHTLALTKIAKKAWTAAMKGINNHRKGIRVAVMQVLADASTATDVIANKVVERVLGTKSLGPFLDINSDRLKPLALSAPNPKLACIWETEEAHEHGFRTVLQNGTAFDSAGNEDLMSFLGALVDAMLVICLSYACHFFDLCCLNRICHGIGSLRQGTCGHGHSRGL